MLRGRCGGSDHDRRTGQGPSRTPERLGVPDDHTRDLSRVRELGLARLLLRRATYFTYFAIAFVATWQGVNLIPTLLDGFALAATPVFLIRLACVVCLGCGIGLLVISMRMFGEGQPDDAETDELEDEDAVLAELRS